MDAMVNSRGFSRAILPAIFFILVQGSLFSQPVILKGTVKDEKTKAPVGNVNIRIFGTTGGISTDNAGQFSLELAKVPASLVVSCVGYEVEYIQVGSAPVAPLEIFLAPKSYTLQEVDISSRKFSFIFKDREYSVLDYELWEDDIFLLVFRNGLNQSELLLLNIQRGYLHSYHLFL
jgi:hypothetical protein